MWGMLKNGDPYGNVETAYGNVKWSDILKTL